MSIPAPDEESRRGHVRSAVGQLGSLWGLGLTVNVEDSFLLQDAMRCYIHGADSGAIFCAHASCERDLAAMVHYSESVAPAESSRWGLGMLITHVTRQASMPSDLSERLVRLNNDRKALYHFGHSDTGIALAASACDLITELGESAMRDEFRKRNGYDGGSKEVWFFAITAALQRNAIAAVTTACLLRAWVAVADVPSRSD